MAQTRSAGTDAEVDFFRVAEETMNHRAIPQSTIGASFRIKGKRDRPVRFQSDLGDIEDVQSLMLDVRKFFLQQEAAHFPSIVNNLEQQLTDDELRDANRANRESWKRAKRGAIALDVHGAKYDAAKMFDLMIKGGLFHSDDALAGTWDALDPMSQRLTQSEVHGRVMN